MGDEASNFRRSSSSSRTGVSSAKARTGEDQGQSREILG